MKNNLLWISLVLTYAVLFSCMRFEHRLGTFSITSATAGNGQVQLTWEPALGATSYTVKRGTVSGDYPTTVTESATSPYTDTTVTNGTTYYYMVTAIGARASRNATSEKNATPSTTASGTTFTKTFGVATQITSARGIAVDTSDYVVAAGYTGGNLDGNTLTGSQDLFITKYDSAGTRQWTRLLGVAGAITTGQGVAISGTSIYAGGYTFGNLDSQTLTGTTDLFLTKYNSAGTKQWTRLLGVGAGQTFAFGVGIDSAGNPLVIGESNGNFDGHTVAGLFDLALAKYDSAGTKQWTALLGVAAVNTVGYAVAADSANNVFAFGITEGGVDSNVLVGTKDALLVKYNASGTRQWTRQLGVAGASTDGLGVATDSGGNIYVVGYTTGALSGNALTGTTDAFVAKYDTSGARQWTRLLGVAAKSTKARAVAVDSAGSIIVTGETTGALPGNVLTGDPDLFLAKYDSSGTRQWVSQIGATSNKFTIGFGAGFDSSLSLYLAGTTSGNLDGNTLIGINDGVITKFTSAGTK